MFPTKNGQLAVQAQFPGEGVGHAIVHGAVNVSVTASIDAEGVAIFKWTAVNAVVVQPQRRKPVIGNVVVELCRGEEDIDAVVVQIRRNSDVLGNRRVGWDKFVIP